MSKGEKGPLIRRIPVSKTPTQCVLEYEKSPHESQESGVMPADPFPSPMPVEPTPWLRGRSAANCAARALRERERETAIGCGSFLRCEGEVQVGFGSLWGLIDYQFGDIGKYIIEARLMVPLQDAAGPQLSEM